MKPQSLRIAFTVFALSAMTIAPKPLDAAPRHANAKPKPPAHDWVSLQRGGEANSTFGYTILQRLLRAHGYAVTVDDKFGLQTELAVRQFQKSQHLHVDGIVGSRTWEKLIIPLKRGSHGEAVLAVQYVLNSVQDNPPALDGKFGEQTERAVRKMQRDWDLKADGIIGPATWCRLAGPWGD